MLAGLVRWLCRVFPILSYDYRHRIKPVQICLACGNKRRMTLQFDPSQKLVVTTCPECKATWGYNPIIKADKWVKTAVVEE